MVMERQMDERVCPLQLPSRLSGGLLPRPVLQLSIQGKNKDSFPELHVDIGKETENLGTGDFADLFAEFVTALSDQVLPKALDHFDTFRGLRQLTLSRCQHAFEPNYNQIARDQRTDFVRAAAQKFLLKLNDGITDRIFHVYIFLIIGAWPVGEQVQS
jgi:hypothetical protein